MNGLHFAWVLLVSEQKAASDMQGLQLDIALGKDFFSVCLTGKQSALLLECLHSRQDVVHIKTDCSFSTRRMTPLGFYCLHHRLLWNGEEGARNCRMCAVTVTSDVIYVLCEIHQREICLLPKYFDSSTER